MCPLVDGSANIVIIELIDYVMIFIFKKEIFGFIEHSFSGEDIFVQQALELFKLQDFAVVFFLELCLLRNNLNYQQCHAENEGREQHDSDQFHYGKGLEFTVHIGGV